MAKRFEWHYTPKHGSWLNMAEAELAILAKQCLDRRIDDQAALKERSAPGLPSVIPPKPKPIALHNQGRPHQIEKPVPSTLRDSSH